jgi:hypothetical protein
MKLEKMHKEALLMTNIARDYWSRVPEIRWMRLRTLLDEKTELINKIVAGNPEVEESIVGMRSLLDTKLRKTASGIVLAA